MTIFNTAYNTTACAGFVMKKTEDALKAAAIYGQLHPVPECNNIFAVEGGSSVADDVPAFAHPVHLSHNGTESIVVDVRSFGKWDGSQATFHIRNEMEYRLAVHRAKLNQIWIKDDAAALRDVSQVPLAIYASWVSEALAKRFALDPREQLNVAILAGIFYCSLFTTEANPQEREKLRMTNAISRALRASAQDVLDVMDKVSYIANTTEFCAKAAEVSGSVRLHDLNVGLLFSILGGTWFGTNSKEMVAVALEHPPTWISILLAAFTERSFKNSVITKIVERVSAKEDGKGYVRSVLNLIAILAK